MNIDTNAHQIMARLNGESIQIADIPEYTFFSHLINYDGPLLSLFKGADDSDALFLWVDNDSVRNRWCIIPVTRDNLRRYFNQECTLRNLIELNDNVIFVNYRISHTHDGVKIRRSKAISVNVGNIPVDYMPTEQSYLFDEICTDEALDLKASVTSSYMLGLDKDLFIDDLSIIPKKFLELYSFHYVMSNIKNMGTIRDRISKVTSRWDGGISAVNMFSGFNNLIPSIHRPSISSLVYNSPGHIELNLIHSVASKIEMSTSISNCKYNRLVKLYSSTYSYFREHGLSGFDAEIANLNDAVEIDEAVSENLKKRIRIFSKLLSLDYASDHFTYLGNTELQRLRTILAYYRRIRILILYQQEGKLNIGHSLVEHHA